MNDRLEAFRQRLRGSERTKPNWQFWIGSPTAWLALVISSATAFSALIYHSDELSIVADPLVLNSRSQIGVQVPHNITYVNSGSRPVAVLSVHMVVAQQTVKTEPVDCSHGKYEKIEIASDQGVVVKPYDTVSRELALVGAERQIRMFNMTDLNKNEFPDRPRLAVCLVFQMVANDSSLVRRKTIAMRFGEDSNQLKSLTPLYLIKRNTFWTFVGGDDTDPLLNSFVLSGKYWFSGEQRDAKPSK